MSAALEAAVLVRKGRFTLDARFTAPGDGVTAVFGPSGAGKSLLLSALAGLVRLQGGRVALGDRILDEGATRVPAHARGVGVVFQDGRLFPHLSVRGNLRFAERRAPEGRRTLSLEDAARRFDFTALLDRPVRNLSGGEKARVALARALISAPDFLLLDEPFAALDGARRRAFLATLRDLHEAQNLPMLVVTHQIDDVAVIADHAIGMRQGRVVAAGPLAQVTATAEFQSLLDARDTGAVMPLAALRGAAGRSGGAWVRADHVLLATAAPQGLSARNVWPGRIAALQREDDGAVLARVDTEVGAVFARVTAEAAAELALTEGKAAWAIVKAHAV